jgi:acyl-homoserine-lactone acylase
MSRSTIRYVAAAVLAVLLALPAVAGADVTIRRSAHGIPHVSASDFRSLGEGYGFAFAEDNLCTMADQYVTVRGERSRFFGPDATWQLRGNGSTNRNLDSDFFFRRIIAQGTVERLIAQPAPNGPRPEVRDLVRGYMDGYNRYLRDTGVEKLPDPACRGKEWVRPIEEIDVYRRFYQLALLASGAVAINGIGGAQPPAPGDVGGPPGREEATAAKLAEVLPLRDIGSNAYGFGASRPTTARACCSATRTSRGTGRSGFYQSHLTIPGKLDVQGGSLFGVPIVLIGNTRGLAWSHTVSTAYRFTPFELPLVPGSPTTYLVDGQPKEMRRTELTVPVRGADGTVRGAPDALRHGVRPGVHRAARPAAVPVDAGQGVRDGRRQRGELPLPQPLLRDEPRPVRARVRRRAAPQPGRAVGQLDRRRLDRRGLLRRHQRRAARSPTTRPSSATPRWAARRSRRLRLPVLDGARGSCGWGRDPSAIQPGRSGRPSTAVHVPQRLPMNANDSYWLGNLKQRWRASADHRRREDRAVAAHAASAC